MISNIVSHVELPVLNFEKAKSFFGEVFGWDIDLESFPDYGLATLGDPEKSASIGLFKVEKIPEKGINVVFEVEDVEKTLKKIENLKGKTIREKYLIAPEVGYAAQFTDIFGIEYGLHAKK
ncbi:MAG: VOC family protein [Candidatus Hodarchaeales archaeon]|jgi:predicted enzyme related to lactoylglutathione lyase